MFGKYIEARNWLENFIPLVYGKEELGLARIENLLTLLGNPEKKFKSIHVAGTSGKGSTAFYSAKLLQRTGFKVGLHVSPHLTYIGERMQINGRPISLQRLIRLISQIRPIVESMENSTVGLPSYFEILVAATFKYFAEEKVDWGVIEVGLGGRLDATNVLVPKVSVITNIGLDHTEILGKTIEKIAFEKAGIIKRGVPVVTGAKGKALKVIEKVAKEKGSPLFLITNYKFPITKKKKIGRTLNWEIAEKAVAVAMSLRGVKLRSNLNRDRFAALGMTVENFPGRFEEIQPGVILDGAHNPDKIKALIEWLKNSQQLTVNSQLILVLAFKKGKRWKKMVDLLVKNLPVKQVIATKFQAVTDTGKFSTVPAEEIRSYIELESQSVKVESVENSQEAVFTALQSTINHKQEKFFSEKSTIVLVTGSLYLIGEVRTMWQLPSFM